MDWLVEVEPTLAHEVYHQVADLLNLDVDLLFFDTTSTYFVTDVDGVEVRCHGNRAHDVGTYEEFQAQDCRVQHGGRCLPGVRWLPPTNIRSCLLCT